MRAGANITYKKCVILIISALILPIEKDVFLYFFYNYFRAASQLLLRNDKEIIINLTHLLILLILSARDVLTERAFEIINKVFTNAKNTAKLSCDTNIKSTNKILLFFIIIFIQEHILSMQSLKNTKNMPQLLIFLILLTECLHKI